MTKLDLKTEILKLKPNFLHKNGIILKNKLSQQISYHLSYIIAKKSL